MTTTNSTTDPDRLRDQIERTRTELSTDVNALTEKVSPSRAMSRQVDRTRGALASMKDAIMGTTTEATGRMTDTVSQAASSTGEAITSAPDAARRRAEGNPLAAGLVAFGLGWLVSSLMPVSRKEQELASQATDRLGEQLRPVAEQVQQAASEVADNLREPAAQAADSVRSTASEAVSTVADEGRAAAGQVTDRTQQARDQVSHGSGQGSVGGQEGARY
jgi:gas vesicle protein